MSLEDLLHRPRTPDELKTPSRRNVLKVIGVGLATGGLFATRAVARTETLTQQLAIVRAATRKYRDIAAAKEDGYTMGPVAVPSVGHVFVNSNRIEDCKVTIAEPEALIYVPTNCKGEPDHSDFKLAAVEYVVPGDRSANPPDLFADESASRHVKVTEEEGWHPNEDADVTGLHVGSIVGIPPDCSA